MTTGTTAQWWRIAIGGGGGMLVCMGLGRFSFTAMVPALIDAGTLTAVEAGRVGTANLAGFLLGALLAERARRSVAVHRLLGACVAVGIAMLFASALPWGFGWLAACRGIIGIATGILMIQSLALIAATAPATRRPVAASFMFAGVGLGILLSGLLVPWLAASSLASAWLGLALGGLIAGAIAVWGWAAAARLGGGEHGPGAAPAWPGPLVALAAAHGLFALGIVPHSLYWVDYIARGLGHGLAAGGLHWSIVGVFSFLGPWILALLALAVGTAPALVVGFLLLAAGIAWPAAWPAGAVLLFSSVTFGMQPGLSSLLAARTRDLSTAAAMPRVMRSMILASSAGSAVGGLLVPALFERGGGHAPVLLLGGAAMLAGAILAMPWRAGIARE